MLKFHFVTNNWPDIAKKLQKVENWKDKSLDDLLREAQKSLCEMGWSKKKKTED
jgi:hypothetical protein